MGTLTNQFIQENKVDNKFQRVVLYCDSKHVITGITEKNIMLQQLSKDGRGNCGRYNSGRHRVSNNENSTQWYLENRVIE